MRRILTTLALLLWLPMVAFAGDPVTAFEDTDPVMNAAMAEARATLPKFLKHVLVKGQPTDDGALLKVAFDTSQGGIEIIWVERLQMKGADRYVGRLLNNPHDIPGKKQGSKVGFTTADIRDWSLSDPQSGKLFGNYTTRVIATTLSGEQRDYIDNLLTSDPLPKGW